MLEPWLRGTLQEIDPIRRQVLHALELTEEDCTRWTADLTPEEIEARPFGLASPAFHLRHIARSLDRLLTYAEGHQLTEAQLQSLRSEMTPTASPLQELQTAIAQARHRILNLPPETFEAPRPVGRDHLPSTVAGLIIHCAEHTQRHVGQAITTSKVVKAQRPPD